MSYWLTLLVFIFGFVFDYITLHLMGMSYTELVNLHLDNPERDIVVDAFIFLLFLFCLTIPGMNVGVTIAFFLSILWMAVAYK